MDDNSASRKPDSGDGERSPLLLSQASSHDSEPRRRVEELSVPRLLALTCINGGLQVFFSSVMANLAPYLQKLGLSKSATAPIIICLPLSGAFIGPLSGALSDRLRTRWGRRRPIIVGGTIFTSLFLVLLAWVKQMVESAHNCEGGSCDESIQHITVALAVLFTIFMAISVQPVQAGVRALMVDIAPAAQQDRAASWAGRIQGVASIFSFFASSLDLARLPGLGHLTQFQILACLNLITLGSTVLITCIFIHEKIKTKRADVEESNKESVKNVFLHIFKTVQKLEGRLRRACETQFSSWFAWFPFLYYNTTYIGELANKRTMSSARAEDQLAQAGSLGALSFAIVGFVTISGLPLILPYIANFFQRRNNRGSSSQDDMKKLIWLWVLTQPILGILLIVTLAASKQWHGIMMVAIAGVPWAVTQWVPFAIVGNEVSRLGLCGTDEEDDETDSESGAIMGVHNMAISLPQVLSGLVSSLVYMIAEKAGSDVPTSWVLAFSGIAAFVAAYLAKLMLR